MPQTEAARTAAFFDLDKTVVAKSSALAFSRELYREGFISPPVVLKTAYAQLSYQLLGASAEKMERSREALLELTRGWQADKVKRLVRETMQEVIDPLIYQEALDLFAEHRRAGRELYLVSSAGEEVVQPLAEYLGVPHVIATRMAIDEDGCYAGELEFYAYAENKAEAIIAEAERRGLDLAGSYAYSDSITDLPMLETVGVPVAVNPDRDLRTLARERGWEVRDFVRPVPLRNRLAHLPRPPAEVLAGASAVGALMVTGWVLYHRRSRPRPGRAVLDRIGEATGLAQAPGGWRR